MSDENAEVTTPQPNEVISDIRQKKPRRETFWTKFWWIPMSFAVPFVVIYFCMDSTAHLNLASCFRSGTIGIIVGAAVFALWSLDQKIQGDKDKTPVGPMIGMLGMMLWLGWVVAAHVIVLANDEANYVADSDRNDSYTISRPSH